MCLIYILDVLRSGYRFVHLTPMPPKTFLAPRIDAFELFMPQSARHAMIDAPSERGGTGVRGL